MFCEELRVTRHTPNYKVFDDLITSQKKDFVFKGRNRRPPLDNVNCLLSFIYTLVMHDVRSALESVGLDSAVGFLHRDRPGRPGLALDMMEEFSILFLNVSLIRPNGRLCAKN
jgi:CRISPR-associated protein Cas1